MTGVPNIIARDVPTTVTELGNLPVDFAILSGNENDEAGIEVGCGIVPGLVGTRVQIGFSCPGADSLVALLTLEDAALLVELIEQATRTTPVSPVLQ